MAEFAGRKARHGRKLLAYQASVTELEPLQAAVAQRKRDLIRTYLIMPCWRNQTSQRCMPLSRVTLGL